MRRKRIAWDRLVPLGVNARQERNLLLGLLLVSLCWSLGRFLGTYFYRLSLMEDTPQPYVRMPAFGELLRGSGFGFFLTALCMLAMAAGHWLYHYHGGSRSIYLMRRLPDKWDLWRRCLTLPLLGLLGSLLLPLSLLLVYFAVYRLCTPPDFCDPLELQGQLYRILCRLFS